MNVQQIVEKHLSKVADKISHADYMSLLDLVVEIEEALPPELQEIDTEQLLQDSISHITDPGLHRVLTAVVRNQINYITQDKVGFNGTQCAACTNTKIKQDCQLYIPLVVQVMEKVYPLVSEWVGVQPMQGPVGLAYQMVTKDKEGAHSAGKEIVSSTIEAGSRRLAARWTIEAMRDVGDEIHVYDEVTDVLSTEIAEEIVSEIIHNLREAGWNNDIIWDETIEEELPSPSTPDQLVEQIIAAADRLYQKGNFVILSPAALTLLQTSKSAKFTTSKLPSSKLFRKYCGELVVSDEHSISVFIDTLDEEDTVIVGYKGESAVDAGYLWAPYIPLMSTGVIADPVTFQPMINFMTRYGNKFFANALYYKTFKVNVTPESFI